MHSLLSRITTLIIAAVLISIVFLGLVSVLSMRAEGEATAQKFMDILCEEKCQQINHYLESGEDLDATDDIEGNDYDALIKAVSEMEALDGGYVFLTDADGNIVYHPMLAAGTPVSRMNEALDEVGASVCSDKMVAYRFQNERMRAVWDTLDNGMKLIVAVPEDEVNAGWRGLAALVLIIGAMLLGVFALVTGGVISRVTQPLQRLVRASKQVAEGNYDVELKYDEDDEVGAVSVAFNQMAQQLKVFVGDLNSRAYKDALTRVSNKGAFEIAAKDLDERILAAGEDDAPKFAIAVFDCNDLKSINDNYGHDKGDIYLKKACMTICNVFAHSPVFRIGGDEFAVILKGEDLKSRSSLEELLAHRIGDINAVTEDPWEKVSIAGGIVEYDPRVDADMESVLRRADELMYEDKKKLKEERKRTPGL